MGYNDAIMAEVSGIIQKSKKGILGKQLPMVESKIKISASVESGVMTLDVPDKDIKVSCRIQDIMAVLTESNRAYKEAHNKSLLVKE